MNTTLPVSIQGLQEARQQLHALVQDVAVLVEDARRSGNAYPVLRALTDPSAPVLALLRGAAACRAALGSCLGLSDLLARKYDVEISSNDIGGGLRLPDPSGIVIGRDASVGRRCTLKKNITIEPGARLGEGVELAAGAYVLHGGRIGDYAHVGPDSVVRGTVPKGVVVLGVPASVVCGELAEALAA